MPETLIKGIAKYNVVWVRNSKNRFQIDQYQSSGCGSFAPVILDEPREFGDRLVLLQVLKGFYDCDEVFLLRIKWIHCLLISPLRIASRSPPQITYCLSGT